MPTQGKDGRKHGVRNYDINRPRIGVNLKKLKGGRCKGATPAEMKRRGGWAPGKRDKEKIVNVLSQKVNQKEKLKRGVIIQKRSSYQEGKT